MNSKRKANPINTRGVLLTAGSMFALMCGAAEAQEFRGTGGIFANGVSADGQTVVGEIQGPQEAFAWTPSLGLVRLGDLPGGFFFSRAWAVSADGSVIVGESDSGVTEAFRWEGGVMTGLGFLAGMTSSEALAVSADGSVVVGGSSGGGVGAPFRWEAGVMTSLGTLGGSSSDHYASGVSADGSVVVGTSVNISGYHEAFRWTQSDLMVGLGFIPGHVSSSAHAISADGLVVVGESYDLITNQAFRWTQSTGMVGLGFLPGDDESTAKAVNADGSVVVGYSAIEGDASSLDAFYWTQADGMRSLEDVLAADGVDLTGWQLQYATGVSANGLIVVGYGTNPSSTRESFWVRLLQRPPASPDFELLVGENVDVTGVSGDGGTIVGGRNVSGDNEAFAWTRAGGFIGLGDLPGGQLRSEANAANADGSVVVGFGTTATGREAFRWAGGVMTGLGVLPGMTESVATAVNADGTVVVGGSDDTSGVSTAFRWAEGGGMTSLGSLGYDSVAQGVSADGSIVVGKSRNGSGHFEGFRWSAGDGMVGLGFLPGHQGSSATAISADGAVIVGASGHATEEAFRWTELNGMMGLGFLPGDNRSVANAVNGDGSVVVGYSSNGGGDNRAFYWTTSDSMRSLADVLTAAGVNLGGWELTFAMGVSADGSIVVGNGVSPDGDPAGFWARIAPASPPPPPGGGNPPPPGGGNPPPPGSGILGESVLARSAHSTSAVLSSAIAGANLDGAMQMSGAGGSPRDVQLAMLTGDGPLPAESRNRPGELRAFVLGGSSNYNGDITSAQNADATWGLSYQATREIRIGGALRYMTFDGDLPAFAGRAELEGHVLQGFAAYERGSQGLRIHVAAAAGQSDANIDRGYLNGATPEISRGERDGEFTSAAIKAGWRVPVTVDASLTPFVRYDVARVELDGYTETGGTFPARFDPIDDTIEIARLGVEGGVALARGLDFEGALAWGHRFDEHLSPISGQVIGLTPFYYAGARVEPDWTEASAALLWSPSDGVNVRFGLGASTDGDTTPDLSAALGVSMRM